MSQPKTEQTTQTPQGEHTRRDAETAIMLGGFIFVVSIPVLIGTFYATQSHAQIVNLLAGLVLCGIGATISFWGWWTVQKTK